MLENLMKWLNDQITMHERAMSAGAVSGYEEYKFLCGKIQGFRATLTELENLKHKWETDNE